jgi:hypothetical protein
MPPLCRFVLPHRVVGYHLVRYEMVLWLFLGFTAVAVLALRRVQRAQNPPRQPMPVGRQASIRTPAARHGCAFRWP